MINLSTIINLKFINYFQNRIANTNDPIFSLFLTEMNNIVELNNLSTNPVEDLKILMNKFNYSSSYYDHIKDIIPFIDSLSLYELFLLLYFSTCRNTLTYDESFYIQSIENGNIYNILLEIKNRS